MHVEVRQVSPPTISCSISKYPQNQRPQRECFGFDRMHCLIARRRAPQDYIHRVVRA
jgi:hypothetical protein